MQWIPLAGLSLIVLGAGLLVNYFTPPKVGRVSLKSIDDYLRRRALREGYDLSDPDRE